MPNLVTIRGLDDIGKVLSQIAPNEAKNLMRTTTYAIAQELTKEARINAPEDQGDLHASMLTRRGKTKAGQAVFSAEAFVAKSAFYWRFLEYGQGPDGVEHAFYLRSLKKMEAGLRERFLRVFVDKLMKRIARVERAASKSSGG